MTKDEGLLPSAVSRRPSLLVENEHEDENDGGRCAVATNET